MNGIKHILGILKKRIIIILALITTFSLSLSSFANAQVYNCFPGSPAARFDPFCKATLFLAKKASDKIGGAILDGVGAAFATAFIWILQTLATLVKFIAGQILTLIGYFLKIAISLNQVVMEGVAGQRPVAEIGWQITRDVANLGFVVVIIIIAFATIFRFKQYAAGRLLPKLIAAAILVNFSFAIVGMMVNFTNTVMNFFLQPITNGSADIGSVLNNSFQLSQVETTLAGENQSISTPEGLKEATKGKNDDKVAQLFAAIIRLFFIITFYTLLGISLLALAIMLLIRYVYIIILAILSPFVFLLWVTPKMERYMNEWWDKLISWTFFAPAMAFFIYVAVQAAPQIQYLSSRAFGVSGMEAFLQTLMMNIASADAWM